MMGGMMIGTQICVGDDGVMSGGECDPIPQSEALNSLALAIRRDTSRNKPVNLAEAGEEMEDGDGGDGALLSVMARVFKVEWACMVRESHRDSVPITCSFYIPFSNQPPLKQEVERTIRAV